MENRVFKRKIYNQMVEWKRNSKGSTALLVEGARRIGKLTIVEEFAKNATHEIATNLHDTFSIISGQPYLDTLPLLFA